MASRTPNTDSVALRIAAIYAVVSLLWILFSDRIVNAISVDRATLTELQTLKGWVFVLLSAAIIFLLVRYHLRRAQTASEALVLREQRHADLFRNAPMAIWEADLSEVRRYLDLTLRSSVVDPGMTLQANSQFLTKLVSLIHIHKLNQGAIELVGADSESGAIAYSPLCFHDGADHAIFDALSQLYHGAHSVQVESRIRTIDGEARSVLMRIAIAPDVADSWERVIIILVDISARKEMEIRLQDRERMLSEAQRLGNLGAYEWNLRTGKLDWSDESYRIHGVDPLRFTPSVDALMASICEEDLERTKKSIGDALAQRVPSGSSSIEGDYRIRRPDGQIRTLLARSEFFFDADGNPMRAIGVEQDITERKQMSDFLERYNISLQRLVTVIQQLSFMHDVNSLANLVSSAAQVLVGADVATFALREGDWVRCIAEQAEKPFFKGLNLPLTACIGGWVILNRQAAAISDIMADPRVPHDLYYKSGVTSLMIIPIRQEDPVGIVGVCWKHPHTATPDEMALLQALADASAVALTNIRIYQDLDASRREAERKSEENLRLYEEAQREMCERKEADRRRLELEAQLRQSQKMEVVGILAGGIAHDFNNILTPLCGNADLALDVLPPGSEGREEIEHVLVAANRARSLIQQILTFSRRSDQVRQPVSLAAICTETIKLLRSSLPSNIQIRFEPDGLPHTVMADPAQLHQVVMNLCTNAYHAMRDSGGILEITLTPAPADAVACYASLRDLPCERLQVRDTGCGMEPSVLDHIFEPFFTTKDKGEGTGLGLAVVQSIITAHGGEIAVESRPGSGTTFAVYLPQIETVAPPDATPVKQPSAGKGERILLVDDEVAIVTLLRKVLTRLGYEVVSFSDSAVALDGFRLSPQQFDLVIFDWNMPQISGRQLAASIRAIRQDVPLLLMTGLRHELSSDDLATLGITQCIRKPFTPFEMTTVVHNLLQAQAPLPAEPAHS